jgi:hypothetical protein
VRHFREVRHYYAEPAGSGQTHYTREGTAELLERWPGRVVHCESTADLNALLNCIATADPARTTGPANGLSL